MRIFAILGVVLLLGACTAEGEYDPKKHDRIRAAACLAAALALEEFKAADDEDNVRRTESYIATRCLDIMEGVE